MGSNASSVCATALSIFAIVAGAHAAAAPEYPTKPVRIVVSTATGAGPDVVARLIGLKLTEAWGQPIVVDARPGASGLIGAETTAKSLPDGYTMWLGTMTTMIGTLMMERHLMAEDFAPVGLVATTVQVIAVSASLPVNSVAELIVYAKAKPGQLLYGSSGSGTTSHLCMESFNATAGIKMDHVPYKAATTVLIDLMAGQVQVTCASALSWQSLKGGRVRGLGVTTSARSSLVPELPPVAESLSGFEMLSWLGLVAPKSTPKEIIAKINSALVKVLKAPDVQERFIGMGAEAVSSTPEEFGAYLRSESAKWGKVLRDADIRPTK